jgi:hypothetical protein
MSNPSSALNFLLSHWPQTARIDVAGSGINLHIVQPGTSVFSTMIYASNTFVGGGSSSFFTTPRQLGMNTIPQ